MQDRLRKITAVASDLDGTILSSDQSLHPRTESVIRRIINAVSPLETTEGDRDGPAVSIVGYDRDDLYTTDADSEEV